MPLPDSRHGKTSDPPDALFLDFQEALAGRYFLERELGRGGMGIVFLAREVRLDRLVAIKLLPPHLVGREALRDRFLREARTAARLSQPNIIPIFSVDHAGEFVFYVMAYVDGETLAQRIATRGAIPPGDAARIMREVAWALAYAHAQGVVHRDIKPENILLERGSGRAMVADFGIARLAEASGGTGVGEVVGTPRFMSPEQAAGETVDGRSDLYSLGVVGFNMVTGRLPFDGPTAVEVLAQHLTKPAPRVAELAPAVPRALAQVIDRCLAKQRADRFASGEALAEALGDALDERREVPVPVRIFLRTLQRDRGSLTTIGVLLTFGVWAGLVGQAYRTGGAFGVVLATLGWAGILGVASGGIYGWRARRLLKTGYGIQDVATAVRAEQAGHREELLYEHGERRSWLERVGWKVGLGLVVLGIGVAMLGTWSWEVTGPSTGPITTPAWIVVQTWFVGLSATSGTVPMILSARQRAARRALEAGYRPGIWSGWLGRWIFKLSSLGLKHPAVAAVNRPTELAIGAAVDVLFQAMPKDLRHTLVELPGVVRRLEQKAEETRARVDELDRLIAEANAVRPNVRTTERRAAMSDLEAARGAAQRRMGEIVTALEGIRLDLLRLRVGAGSVESVTADLAAARVIGEQTDRLLQAGQEIDAALRSPPPSPPTDFR